MTGKAQGTDTLTTPALWDARWAREPLPTRIERGRYLFVDEILDVVDRHFPRGADLSALEVGGAPGRWLAYLQPRFGYRVALLDSSPLGVELARKNFELLGIDGRVFEGDLFEAELPERFDVVYSLGLIEHFTDLQAAVAAHVSFLKPGGVLALGCPNFGGINRPLVQRIGPAHLSVHNLAVMDLRRWGEFEGQLGLEVLFRGYIAGFDAGSLYQSIERTDPATQSLVLGLKLVGAALNRPATRALRRLNSRLWSGYMMGVYRTPPAPV